MEQNCAEIVFFLRRVKCHPRFRDERGCLRSFGGNYRQSASDSCYGAASARGDRPANKEEHVATEQRSRDIFVRKQAQHLRSEEHTSELQSRGHLVCRLLLEKKKKRWSRSPAGREPTRSRRSPS